MYKLIILRFHLFKGASLFSNQRLKLVYEYDGCNTYIRHMAVKLVSQPMTNTRHLHLQFFYMFY